MNELPEGVMHLPGYLDRRAQQQLVADIRAVVARAPLYFPTMPRTGKPMSVRMTNCGPLGWVTDRERGYRYQETHPVTGRPWPEMPPGLLALWEELADWPRGPEACLINFYAPEARMGMHQDRDEEDLEAPVVSVSLGDACRFRVGGTRRGGKTVPLRLESGDVVVLGGPGRMCFHGVERIYAGTSDLLDRPGRVNLTLRRVTRA